MRVAVTGASGFCGGAVVRLLVRDGHRVVALGRRPIVFDEPDSSDPVKSVQWRHWDAATDDPDLTGVDAVIHLAAAVGDPRPGVDERAFEQVNVAGARRLLDQTGGLPLAWVSSSSVYDPRPDRSLVTEQHPTVGGHLNAYGRTKAAGDRLALDAGAVVLRPRAVYGPGDAHLLPRLQRAVRRGRLILPGPDVRMSLTHVDNLASACVAALSWTAGAYNVADADPVQRDAVLASVLTAASGRPVAVSHLPVGLASVAAAGLTIAARASRREALLTRYSVDTLGHTFVVDTTRARATGWTPRDLMPAYLDALRSGSISEGERR